MRPDRDTLRGLLERVEAATGPDRDLDGHLVAAFHPPYAYDDVEPWACFVRINGDGVGLFKLYAAAVGTIGASVPLYTAGVDTALALVKLVLPGTLWASGSMEDGPFCRLVYPRGTGWGHAEHVGGASSAPLAILAALLKALLAHQETHTDD